MTRLLPKRLQEAIYFVAVTVTFILLISCGDRKDDSRNDAEPAVDSLVVEIRGSSGRTVLEATLENHELEVVNSAQGVFVRAIDGTATGNGFFWLFSVNDSMAAVSADKYITNDGDVVKWHYRRF